MYKRAVCVTRRHIIIMVSSQRKIAAMSSFAFNFLAGSDDNGDKPKNDTATVSFSTPSQVEDDMDVDANNKKDKESMNPQPMTTTANNGSENHSSFAWLSREEVQASLASCLRNIIQQSLMDSIVLSESTGQQQQQPPSPFTLQYVRETSTTTTTTSDLIPGVYEGGLKVWECSIDLCQYLESHDLKVDGHVLELGCGHGLPGCWVLSKAIERHQQCHQLQLEQQRKPNKLPCTVWFSDFNEFVLKYVTLKNVAINAKTALIKKRRTPSTTRASSSSSSSSSTEWKSDTIASWLADHVVFGAGDWNTMSQQLLSSDNQQHQRQDGNERCRPCCPPIPTNGIFDVILAAETTYSESAARDTARIIAHHLQPNTGRAFVATKRYYFGVGGGTNCLCQELQSLQQKDQDPAGCTFLVETLQVYDNGVGNIRELLCIKSMTT